MTNRYVGPGGNDGNSGLTWALRKLTLNGVEDTPVVAGDTVYVGPGVYREQLTVDVHASSGNQITYIGDVTGENTDGVGGIVRITGSDDDKVCTRDYCITATTLVEFRTLRGFAFDHAADALIRIGQTSGINGWVIEDCYFGECQDITSFGIQAYPRDNELFFIRNCIFATGVTMIQFWSASDQAPHSDSGIYNCLFYGSGGSGEIGISTISVDSFSVGNCTFIGIATGILTDSLEFTISVKGCTFQGMDVGLEGGVAGDIVENYNSIARSVATPRVNTSTGGSSNEWPALQQPAILKRGIEFPWSPFDLSRWSPVAQLDPDRDPTEDLFGLARPDASAKVSWGAIQFKPSERSSDPTRGSSAASIGFDDAGEHQIWVPVQAVSTTIRVYCYREANYAGTLPRMVIKEPGQTDRTTTDTGSASQWNELVDTFTPASTSRYVVVCLQSLNTATSGDFEMFFDDLEVG